MRALPLIAALSIAFVVSVSAAPARAASCECTKEEEQAEMGRIYLLYRDAVNNARDAGFQCGGAPNYVDAGDGRHPVGNCADWAQVSWAALRVHTWRCWKVVKVRARHKFTFWSYHHFVYVESCSGVGYFLDPWKTGAPDYWEKDKFPFQSGFFGGWVYRPLVTHNPGDPPRDPGLDP